MLENPSDVEAEAIRHLRSSVEFANLDVQAKSIMITSSVGFEGKTTTIANLAVTSENYSAAESRIRDADVAYETAIFTRNQILVQSGVAILAQANALPQAALALLSR